VGNGCGMGVCELAFGKLHTAGDVAHTPANIISSIFGIKDYPQRFSLSSHSRSSKTFSRHLKTYALDTACSS
jgi:hypothetical protein